MSTTLSIATEVSPFFALVGMPGWLEITVLLIIGLLVFGKRLPEVGRNLGKSIVEFKKGIKGIGDEIDAESDRESTKEMESSKKADLPPAKVTPDPAKDIEEVEQHQED